MTDAKTKDYFVPKWEQITGRNNFVKKLRVRYLLLNLEKWFERFIKILIFRTIINYSILFFKHFNFIINFTKAVKSDNSII